MVHMCTHSDEERRIRNAGGWIECNRVNGNLALSRAIGDFTFKENKSLPPEQQIITGTVPYRKHDRFVVCFEHSLNPYIPVPFRKHTYLLMHLPPHTLTRCVHTHTHSLCTHTHSLAVYTHTLTRCVHTLTRCVHTHTHSLMLAHTHTHTHSLCTLTQLHLMLKRSHY